MIFVTSFSLALSLFTLISLKALLKKSETFSKSPPCYHLVKELYPIHMSLMLIQKGFLALTPLFLQSSLLKQFKTPYF